MVDMAGASTVVSENIRVCVCVRACMYFQSFVLIFQEEEDTGHQDVLINVNKCIM